VQSFGLGINSKWRSSQYNYLIQPKVLRNTVTTSLAAGPVGSWHSARSAALPSGPGVVASHEVELRQLSVGSIEPVQTPAAHSASSLDAKWPAGVSQASRA